jgi:hypothetical protein
MRLEDREQTLGFDVARRREFRFGFLFCRIEHVIIIKFIQSKSKLQRCRRSIS